MHPPLSPAAMQYGLVMALFALLLGGLLVPGGHAQALALAGTAGLGPPLANGTPNPARPAPPAAAASPSRGGTPDAPPPAAPARPVSATPQAATPAVTVTAAAPTPTTRPSGGVSAAILRGLTPLAFTLTGRTQAAAATLVVAVTDTAPTTQQPGWSLSLTVDRFQVAGLPARALPATAVTLVGVTVTCGGDAACSTSENTIAYPLALPAGKAVTIYTAAPGSGSGQFVVTPTFAVTVPGNASVGNYGTRIVVAVAGGPPMAHAQSAPPASVAGVTATPLPIRPVPAPALATSPPGAPVRAFLTTPPGAPPRHRARRRRSLCPRRSSPPRPRQRRSPRPIGSIPPRR
jgi:hypothetical protein